MTRTDPRTGLRAFGMPFSPHPMTDPQRARYDVLEERIAGVISAGDPALFDAAVLDVYRFQRNANPAYASYCDALGVQDVTSWRDIPAVPQGAFRLTPLRTFPPDSEVTTFRTSGTTGEGCGTHHFCSMRLYHAAILQGWDLLALPPLPQIILIPPPHEAAHSSLSHMMAVMKARAPANGQHWCMSAKNGLDREQLQRLLAGYNAAASPVLILGTALALLHWVESITGAETHLPQGSLIFETGGYKGSGRTLAKETLYQLLSDSLGTPEADIINEYGMTELSSQCYSRGAGSPHTAPPWVRVLVVHPATGREVADGGTGVLRIYDLANLGSVIALQTRDLAIKRGAHFELLGRDPAALPRGCSRAADEMLQ